jgi:predicted TPR repeat methyltransferase
LQHHGRYCHTESYVRATLEETGMAVASVVEVVLRKEMDLPVCGLLVTASIGASATAEK